MTTTVRTPSDTEKAQLWKDYHERKPTRTPMRFTNNPRIYVMNPELNVEGFTFEAAAQDAKTHALLFLHWQRYLRTTLHRFTDSPRELPEVWDVGLMMYNVYDAAQFGATVEFPKGQVPATEPILTEANKRDILKMDVTRPLENPFIKRMMAFSKEMERVCEGMKFEGRPVRMAPFAVGGTSGPMTVCCDLRGSDFLIELIEDPEFSDALLDLATRAAICRRQAFWDLCGEKIGRGNWFADDSCAMLSVDMYRERILPHHRRYYESGPASAARTIHLCGNATHLFPTLHQELGVSSFDTGFPVDHGKIRGELGPDVEISGGPPVQTLLHGTPESVFARTKEVLLSGVKEGRRFILQEGNNLPPCCPLANLEAMYAASLEFGGHGA